MLMPTHSLITLLVATTASVANTASGALLPGQFTAPMQPWNSPDGAVRLLRPAIAQPTTSDEGLTPLMQSGWRLTWNPTAPRPGRIIVRLVIKVRPDRPGTASEVLQVGASRNPGVIRTCLSYGLHDGFGKRLPDRVINGVRFAAWSSGDGGMSHFIGGNDLRAVVGRTCYAIDRFSFGESASDGDPSVVLPQTAGAAMLDAALASLRIGQPSRAPLPIPHLALPRGVVAR